VSRGNHAFLEENNCQNIRNCIGSIYADIRTREESTNLLHCEKKIKIKESSTQTS
jgi:hypothetical protein